MDETDGTGSVTNGNFDEYIYFDGQRVARRDASNDAFYYLNDQVGTTRAIVEVPAGQDTGTLCFDSDYFPFGTQRNPIVDTCSTNYKFTGKELDPATESNLYNSSARFYSSFEMRFMSPDPANAGADPTNPQSWNMYSYVRNNPLSNIDPTGMECVWDDGSYDSADDPDSGSPGQCSNLGGTWVDPSYFQNNNLPDWSPNSGDPGASADFANYMAAINSVIQISLEYGPSIFGQSIQ
ncbi:MAG TPA: RHS repeat-associated core domain-containing protein [Verrucomicrobiae bacterium]|nr:RHS repeat-associated core domain-containing protein [Verrucomicrobiae bacterium]